ncbi:MAG: phospholipase [Bacteroidota bacterium]
MSTQITFDNIPARQGERPRTTNTNPHTQLNQQPEDLSYIKNLMDWAFQLGHIKKEFSKISVPGAIAMCMEDDHTCKSCNAFMVGTEFAHFHPHPDYSMHLGLPRDAAEIFINKGWGEWHPLIERGILPPNIIMLYAPRNQEEFEVAKLILAKSYAYAKGDNDK